MFSKKKHTQEIRQLTEAEREMLDWDIRYIRQQVNALDTMLGVGEISKEEYDKELYILNQRVEALEERVGIA